MEEANAQAPRPRRFPFLGLGILILAVTLAALVFTSRGRSFLREFTPEPKVKVVEKRVEVAPDPEPEPDLPVGVSATAGGDIRVMSTGITFDSRVEFPSGGSANSLRTRDDSYKAEYTLKATLPSAATSLEELEQATPGLGRILPGLEAMLEEAKVSKYFHRLYENKSDRLKKNAPLLNKLLSRHNFYDCNTILNLEGESGRKVLLLQGDMDVVSDGSDGDRLAEMPDEIVNSTHYQPFTSYGWPKQSDRENPMVAGWRKRIGNADRELADPQTSTERAAWLRGRKKYLQRGIEDMQARSFLIAEYDPFIVLPVNVITDSENPYAGRAGDYAAVVYAGKVYPAIVGDGGPTFKIGEGSLRLARALDERASPYRRPVSSLGVTYIVFPSSRGPRQAPDYEAWRGKVGSLIDEIGGLGEGVRLESWKNTLPPTDQEAGEEPGEAG